MSRIADIRDKKVKKLFKGKFSWEIQVKFNNDKKLSPYLMDDTYHAVNQVGIEDFVKNNIAGMKFIKYINTKSNLIEKIYFESFEDVILFKLKFGDKIRNVYQLVV